MIAMSTLPPTYVRYWQKVSPHFAIALVDTSLALNLAKSQGSPRFPPERDLPSNPNYSFTSKGIAKPMPSWVSNVRSYIRLRSTGRTADVVQSSPKSSASTLPMLSKPARLRIILVEKLPLYVLR